MIHKHLLLFSTACGTIAIYLSLFEFQRLWILAMIVSIEILSGLCFIPDEGHTLVLKALTEISESLGERTRFQTLINDLHRNFSTNRDADRVRTAIFGLVNALLRTGPAETSETYRLHLRYELLMLGMDSALKKCRQDCSARLEDHLDLFEMMRKEDELSLNGSITPDSGSSSPVDFESAVGMAEALQNKLSTSTALPHFISLLQHLFMVPCDEAHVPLWRLFDLILQHLTLQSTVNNMTDVHRPIINSVDMQEILARLHNHCNYEKVQKELEKAKEELDLEKSKQVELENRLADLQETRANSGSRISLASSSSSSPSDPCHSPTPQIVLPPICPPTAPPPPPPPPPPAPNFKLPTVIEDVKKNIPQPNGPLKSFNWQKLTSDKVKGSVWETIEDEKMYKQMDLNEIELNFASSSTHRDDDNETIISTYSRRGAREANVTVIDPRRYQNCTIMLSKLKLSHKEIRTAILSMDEKGKLPKDTIEQMLKFVPTKEEINLINEALTKSGTPTVLAIADRYLYEVSLIPRFEQRLRCLHIIRSFKDRVEALLPCVQSVSNTCVAIQNSKRFKNLLGIVLAIGNYINYGKKSGNAYGFDLASLNKLIDVKNYHRSDRNLLHFIVQYIEKRTPDTTKLKRELEGVFEASRTNQAEVATEVRNLEAAIAMVKDEVGFLEKAKKEELPEAVMEDSKKDKFIQVAKQFLITSTSEFGVLEKNVADMKVKYSECAKHFCLRPNSTPEDLFSCLARFITTFSEYHQRMYMEIEEEEKQKRQTIARTFLAKRSTARKREKERDFEQLISALQSGDIFKEELSRLRTSFRPKKSSKIAC